MAFRDGEERIVIGPLSPYRCDGIAVMRIPGFRALEVGVYRISTYEASGEFNPTDTYNYVDADAVIKEDDRVGIVQHVYLTEDEMEELVLAYMILKEGK
jgi:hypothetical protein